MGTENLDKIFNPKSIAVIGASDRPHSVGGKLIKNLVGKGYKGVVYPVNPFRRTVYNITSYPNVTKIPWPVDLAIIATPAHTVPQIVEECGKVGVAGVIIISAGFKEAGEAGTALAKQIFEYKERYKMRVIGPNSLGIMIPQMKLNATFANKGAIPGKIAFISQSAALCASVLDWALAAHMGFSAVVSTGSMLDVDLGDLIDYFGSDPNTKSIVLYVEFLKDVRKFMSATRGFARAKPIILVKAGRFSESKEAIVCHTGALSGEDMVCDAAFRRAGIVRVEAITDLFNCSTALAMQPNPKHPNLTIITNAGGPAIMAADSLIEKGGRLSLLSSKTIQALKSVLPSYCSLVNPIDLLEEATPDRFKKVLDICFKDPYSDGFLIIYSPQGAADPVEVAKIIGELSRQTKKTLLTALMGENGCRTARELLNRTGIPAFTTSEEAVSTFMYMYNYTQNLELLYQTPEELSVDISSPALLKKILRKASKTGREILTLPESFKFLEALKIPTVQTLVATTPEEAEKAALKLGYPVVIKALSPQITHKSKAEGVVLNVWSPSDVRVFFAELAERIKKYDPEAEFHGVTIQPMLHKKGYELLIGSKRTPNFGATILFGMGGSATELIKDVSIGFPPLNQILAKRIIEQTSFYKNMIKGNNAFNIRPIEETLVKFSQLVIEFPEIKEIDINPIILSQNNATAVDARMVIDKEIISQKMHSLTPLIIAPYPKKYITKWKMKDGTPLILRPVKPEDETLLDELFKSFSIKTMLFRFFQIIKAISHETLTRYCNIDYDREIAIVAESQKKQKKIIGITRIILDPGKNRGEFAVVVGDHWQGLGLGSKLLDTIIEISKDMHLKTIYGYVSSNNPIMINLCTKKGFKMEPSDEETLFATLDLS
jgi:acetyltransferase